ncbi:MAG: hypothetical protein IT555_03615 [Acetobacteraceae bacterium]|nr:hypothetical protein [Acetobacteraceae bacterium]
MALTPFESSRLIAGQFAVDLARPMPGWGAGLDCFAATDTKSGRADHMALLVRRDAPLRVHAVNSLAAMPIDGILTPVAHGPAPGPGGVPGWFVVAPAPPGPPLAVGVAWRDHDLLQNLLRPVAHALERLQARHVTHRGIRPANLFRFRTDEPVTLGCAWAAPAASMQPAIFEPPYVAMCVPGGRGEGSIADDVYALGVTLLVLATGRMPMAGMDDATIIRRKLEMGSFAALAEGERLSPAIGDLIRGMLAEEPDHRPPPVLLADPAAARARRVAARPPPRTQRAVQLGAIAATNMRMLSLAIATAPQDGVRLLRSGAVDQWVRRSLGDSTTAAHLEELLRKRATDLPVDEPTADALLACQAIALLDPLAPVCWDGLALFPDGLGGALADLTGGDGRQPPNDRKLAAMVAAEAVAAWARMRPERCDPVLLRVEAHEHRQLLRMRDGGGIARLRYGLNPALPCRSALLGTALVARLSDVLPALEDVAAVEAVRIGVPLDAEIAAFLAARSDAPLAGELARMQEEADPAQAALIALRLLVWLQERQRIPALRNLAAWLGGMVSPLLEGWRNRKQRARLAEALATHVSAGALPRMLRLLDDHVARERDASEAADAARLVVRIDEELAQLAQAAPGRAAVAFSVGHELVLGAGMTALTLSLIATLVM